MKKVMLDEGVPRSLASALSTYGITASAFPNDWKGMKNGLLLRRVEEEGYDVLVTNDQNMYAQQNFRDRKISVVVLPSNRRSVILSRVLDLAQTIGASEPGHYLTISMDGTISTISDTVHSELPSIEPFTR